MCPPYAHYIFTFTSLYVKDMVILCALHVHSIFTIDLLHIHSIFLLYSPDVHLAILCMNKKLPVRDNKSE